MGRKLRTLPSRPSWFKPSITNNVYLLGNNERVSSFRFFKLAESGLHVVLQFVVHRFFFCHFEFFCC